VTNARSEREQKAGACRYGQERLSLANDNTRYDFGNVSTTVLWSWRDSFPGFSSMDSAVAASVVTVCCHPCWEVSLQTLFFLGGGEVLGGLMNKNMDAFYPVKGKDFIRTDDFVISGQLSIS